MIQFALYVIIISLLSPWIGKYIADIFLDKSNILSRCLKPLEVFIYKLSGINQHQEENAVGYIKLLLIMYVLSVVKVINLMQN